MIQYHTGMNLLKQYYDNFYYLCNLIQHCYHHYESKMIQYNLQNFHEIIFNQPKHVD